MHGTDGMDGMDGMDGPRPLCRRASGPIRASDSGSLGNADMGYINLHTVSEFLCIRWVCAREDTIEYQDCWYNR